MSASANADNESAVPCANNCGFWGRASTGNYCSACYKEKLGNAQKSKSSDRELVKVEAEVPEKDEPKVIVEKEIPVKEEKVVVEAGAAEDAEENKKPEKPKQTNRMRCFTCRKKVGLTGTECRCGYVYCGVHRYPEEHECDFDFKALAQRKVARKFAGAIAEKIQGEKL